MDHTNDRLSALEKRCYRLEGEVRRLRQDVERLQGAPQQPAPVFPLNPVQPAYAANMCPACGLTLDKVMGYVCQRVPCPTGLGGAYCTNGTVGAP